MKTSSSPRDAAPLAAATAGLVASVPMLIVMDLLNRTLPGDSEEEHLPPMKVTARMAEKAEITDHVPDPIETIAGFFAHLGFGGSMGLIYGALPRRAALPPAATGIGFGLLVWLFSYAGWLPATRILPPPHRRTPRRNVTIILAHIVWGALLGWLTQRLATQDRPA